VKRSRFASHRNVLFTASEKTSMPWHMMRNFHVDKASVAFEDLQEIAVLVRPQGGGTNHIVRNRL
jgi:hypothetical protein